MTTASGEINLQNKHDLICLIAKVKAATSAHSMADVPVIPFLVHLIYSSNHNEKNIYVKYNENNIHNIFSKY